MVYDIFLDKIFFNDKDKLNVSTLTKFKYWHKRCNKYKNIFIYLNNRFNDSESLRETLYRIHYKIYDKPTCPVCGKPLAFNGRNNNIFLSHCSNSCKRKDKNVQDKWIKTCEENYGSDITNRKKYKQTCLDKYGVDNAFAIKDVIYTIKQKNAENKDTIRQKIIQTNRNKYGVDYYIQTKEFQEKRKITSLQKYGTTYPIQSNVVLSKYNREELEKRRQQTLTKNHTHNTSNPEYESYLLLKNTFDDVIQQYKSNVYPFNCDFYIPKLDLYIECNYHWTHGGHPYNNCKEDNRILNNWKSKNTKYYKTAIDVWTNKDVNKRIIAQANNLNYIEFWNINELKTFISNYVNS